MESSTIEHNGNSWRQSFKDLYKSFAAVNINIGVNTSFDPFQCVA